MKDFVNQSIAPKSIQSGKKKLLIGITLSEVGGSQQVVYDIIANLPQSEYDITLVTSPNGELLEWINDLNKNRKLKVEVITLSSLIRDISLLNDIKAFLDLLRIFFNGKYDIAHFHNSKIGVLGRIAARITGVPKIYYTVHGWGLNASKSAIQYRFMSLLEKVASRLCTKVICVSENDMDKGIRNKWLQKDKVCVIHNGITEAPKIKSDLHKGLGIPDNIPIIASIARLSEPKDPLFTIKVADSLIRAGYDFRLLIIGDGPLRKDCDELITDLEIEKYVLILGMRDDVRELLNDIDIVLLFSKWEGLPIAIIEAMFAGKPVIASNVGGVPELIKHGENGYLLDNFDINQGADYVKTLIEDSSIREAMGHNGKNVAQQDFTLSEMLKQYQAVYSEI